MKASDALEIIRPLADGIDPNTGEVFPKTSPFQNPDTVRALYAAVKILEKEASRISKKKNLPQNTGNKWTKEDDTLLAKYFDEGKSIVEIANIFERTRGGIRARLVKIGKISE